MKKENIFAKIIRIILIILLLPIVVAYLIMQKIKQLRQNKKNEDKIKIVSAAQIDELSGKEFEIMLKDLFESMGYIVKLTKDSHDYGADLIITKGKNMSIVQAKRYDHSVGIRAVQEIIGAKKHYGIHNAIVISNQNFTKDAETLSIENDVSLIDRNALLNLLYKYNVKITRKVTNFVATTQKAVSEIEKKYPNWI